MKLNHKKDCRPKKPKAENKILAAVRQWLDEIDGPDRPLAVEAEDALAHVPKRWVVYEPMVLLPAGSFTAPPWPGLLEAVSGEQRDMLWHGILTVLGSSKSPLTHLAVNEGIPLERAEKEDAEGQGGRGENILRSPSALRPLYGDFGPAETEQDVPLAADFARAFWVSTRQNGITQTWAPRWSMFSRGNVKEKARLLSWDDSAERRKTEKEKETETRKWAVDLYAGIGYFVFSYVQSGLRVLCWELNPWSAEALRRGALLNGWRVGIVSPVGLDGSDGRETTTTEALHRHADADILLFVEDNRHAGRRLAEAAALASEMGPLSIRHVNCGLLPTSRDSWQTAWAAASRQTGAEGSRAWLHLHENVGTADIPGRQREIQELVDSWASAPSEASTTSTTLTTLTAIVEHVELVKTFAPDVWHCVFDVCIRR